MSLDSKFADLEIETKRSNSRRLSGLHRHIPPIIKLQEDCRSSSDSSINEIEELNNENNNSNTEPNCPLVSLRRSSRKRISTCHNSLKTGEYSNTSSKFAKLTANANVRMPLELTDRDSAQYLKEIYLDKTVKLKYNALETIFEEPKKGTGKQAIMSGRKFRRFISFEESVSNATKKTKKRSLKAKRVTTKTRSKTKFSIKKIDLIPS